MSHGEAITLLLVEDDEVDALGVVRALRQQSIANPVVRAHDGVEALEMLRSNEVARPFVVLLDLQMPRMNGLEFLEALRTDPDLEDTVVFVLTTSRARDDISATYHHQVAGYFVKDDVGQVFFDVINVLDGYWKIVHLPNGVDPSHSARAGAPDRGSGGTSPSSGDASKE